MSDQTIPERIAVAENEIKDHDFRIEKLEQTNEDKKNWLIRQTWGLLKMIGIVTFLTILTDLAKDGCKLCKLLISNLMGNS